jgi:hypothetical protein
MYLQVIGWLLLRFLLLLAISLGIGLIDGLAGILTCILLVIIFILLFQWELALALLVGRWHQKLLLALPVMFASLVLMSYKIYINERIPRGPFDHFYDSDRLPGYFIFYIWSSILLWEIYYHITYHLSKKMSKESMSKIKNE